MSIPYSDRCSVLVTGAIIRPVPIPIFPLGSRAMGVVNVLFLGRGGHQSQRWNQAQSSQNGDRRLLVAVQVDPGLVA
jgi:hypothetical protein